MTHQPGPDLDLDAITARATSEHLTPGPWTLAKEGCDCGGDYPCGHGLYVTGVITPTPTWSAAERAKRTGEQPRDYDFHRSDIGDFTTADWELMAHAREDVPALLAEIRRLRDELAETKALNDPRLRGLLVKAAPDKDQYVLWSTVCDMPGGVFSRETALEYGFPRSKVDHADAHGSSSRVGDGAWDDKGWVAEQRGWLRRDLIGEYAVEYLHGDREAAFALLEPFEDESAPAAVESHVVADDSSDPEHTDDRHGCPPAPAGQ